MTTFQTGHIGLNVTDVDRSAQFYQTVFGFQVVGKSTEAEHEFLFLGDGKRLVLTLWKQSHGVFSKQTPGLHHLSFEVDTIEEVQAIEHKIRAVGTKLYHDGVVPHREGGASGGIFFEDPDGIRLEVYSPEGADVNPAPFNAQPTCGFF